MGQGAEDKDECKHASTVGAAGGGHAEDPEAADLPLEEEGADVAATWRQTEATDTREPNSTMQGT